MKRHAVFLFGLMLLSGCTAGPSGGKTSPDADNRIIGFNLAQTVAGKTDWTLVSKEAVVSEKEKKVYLDGINATFYSKGKQISRITSNKGYLDTSTDDLYCQGGCVVTTYRGERLETEELYYKDSLKKIFSDVDVKLLQEDGTIYGKGLEATPDLESIVIKQQRIQTQ